LVNEADDSQVIDSHFFNISIPKPTSTVITPSATFTMTLTSSASYSSPTILQYNEAPVGGLSTGPAIGVGLGCATFLALTALLIVCINRRKNRKRPVIGVGPNDYNDDGNYIEPLAAPSPTNSGQCRSNTGFVIRISPSPYTTYSIERKPTAGEAPSAPITHSIKRNALSGTVPGGYDHRRNYSRPFEVPNLMATSHVGYDSMIPLSTASHAVRGKGRYVPSPSKEARFSQCLETGGYQIPSPSIESDFGEDIDRRLAEVSGPLSDPIFSEDLERRLSEISHYSSLPGSVHGSIYDVSPASCQ
jgi:hypothetical protein